MPTDASVTTVAPAAVSTDPATTMAKRAMTIETRTGTRVAPDPEQPFWRDLGGERLTFQEVAASLTGEPAEQAAERHAEAVASVVRAAALARLRGDTADARRKALAASRLCEEIAGLWPRDSWKPIR